MLCDLFTRHTSKFGMETNGNIDTIASSSCMTENEDENKHIKTGICDNDNYDMAIDDSTISDELLRRMFDSDNDVIIT